MNIFLNRVSVLHISFLHLVRVVMDRNWFTTAARDVVGQPSIPVEIKGEECTDSRRCARWYELR